MPKDPLQIALEHHRGGRYVQAEAGYRGVLEQNPNDAEANHWLGVLLFQAGQPEPAMRFLQHAASIRPQDAAFQFNLGRALHDCKRDDEAIAVFERTVELDPQPYVLLGAATPYLSRRRQGDAERAVELLRRARIRRSRQWRPLSASRTRAAPCRPSGSSRRSVVYGDGEAPKSADAQYQVAATLSARNDATLAAVFLAGRSNSILIMFGLSSLWRCFKRLPTS